MMRDILVCPPGTLTTEAKRELLKHGIIPVEAKDPEKVRLLRAQEIVGHGDLLWAALSAMQTPPGTTYSSDGDKAARQRFATRVFELVDEARRVREPKQRKAKGKETAVDKT